MSFLQKLKYAAIRFMQGRHGLDQLGFFTLLTGLVVSFLSGIFRSPVLSLLGYLLYIVSLFRMLSKNHPARYSENQKYLHYSYEIKTRFNQWIKRVKNTKEYKYFKCPECKVLLRLHRGCGEKSITCPKCSHQFKKKA